MISEKRADTMRISVFLCLWAATVLFAFLKGGGPERMGAIVVFLLTTAVLAFRPYFPAQFRETDWLALLLDFAGAVAFLAIALRAYDRSWPFWASSAQFVALIGHVARAIDRDSAGLAFGILTRSPAYIQCLALLLGTWAYMRRVKRSGNYPSWRD